MKKIACVLMFAAAVFSVSAQDIKDTWFNAFYEATSQKLPAGCQMRKNAQYRIMFLDMALPIKSDVPFDVKAAKAEMLKAIIGTPDKDFIKKAEITVIYNFITVDYKIHSVVITGDDF